MSLIIYHNYPKKLLEEKFNGDVDYQFFVDSAKKCILNGLQDGRGFTEQTNVYKQFIKNVQSRKLYKLSQYDKDYYTICILSLWYLGEYSPDDATSPLWFAPKRKQPQTFRPEAVPAERPEPTP